MDSEAKIQDFSHTAGSPPRHLPFLLPSPHWPALLGCAFPDFPVKRCPFPPLWFDDGGCEGPCCNPVPSCCWKASDDAYIPPLLVPAGVGSPGWTGRVVLLRGDLPALQQTAWGEPRKRTKGTF